MRKIDSDVCHAEFGQYIKTARKERKLTQTDVAEALGVSRVYVSYIERGQREVDLADALRICEVLGVDIRDFVSRYM